MNSVPTHFQDRANSECVSNVRTDCKSTYRGFWLQTNSLTHPLTRQTLDFMYQ